MKLISVSVMLFEDSACVSEDSTVVVSGSLVDSLTVVWANASPFVGFVVVT